MTIGFENFKFQRNHPTTIKYQGVKIVTLKPYCGRGLRIQPNKLVDARKEIKHINSGYRKKSLTLTHNIWKASKFNFLWSLSVINNKSIRLIIIS